MNKTNLALKNTAEAIELTAANRPSFERTGSFAPFDTQLLPCLTATRSKRRRGPVSFEDYHSSAFRPFRIY